MKVDGIILHKSIENEDSCSVAQTETILEFFQ